MNPIFLSNVIKKMSENSKTSSLQFSRAQGNGLAFIEHSSFLNLILNLVTALLKND